jgi:hypothetical protein
VTRHPRFFVLTAGATPDDAIDFVESRGHVVIATRLTGADSVPVYGISEVEPSSPLTPRQPSAILVAMDDDTREGNQ